MVFKGAGFDVDAQSTETILRPGRSALCDVQLLPAAATARNRTLARLLSENSRPGALEEEFPAPRIRGDAGARSPVGERTSREQSVDCATGAEAGSFT